MLKKFFAFLVFGLFILTISSAIGTTIQADYPGNGSASGTMVYNGNIHYTLSVSSAGYAVFIYNSSPRDSQTSFGSHSGDFGGYTGGNVGVQAYASSGQARATATW